MACWCCTRYVRRSSRLIISTRPSFTQKEEQEIDSMATCGVQYRLLNSGFLYGHLVQARPETTVVECTFDPAKRVGWVREFTKAGGELIGDERRYPKFQHIFLTDPARGRIELSVWIEAQDPAAQNDFGDGNCSQLKLITGSQSRQSAAATVLLSTIEGSEETDDTHDIESSATTRRSGRVASHRSYGGTAAARRD